MIILDTHAWLWWINESTKLSDAALTVIEQTDSIGISAISCWEVSMLVGKSRIGLSMDVEIWLDLALQRPKVRLLPITPQIAVLSTRLPGDFHGDPADRLIGATARAEGMTLVTRDEPMRKSPLLKTVW